SAYTRPQSDHSGGGPRVGRGGGQTTRACASSVRVAGKSRAAGAPPRFRGPQLRSRRPVRAAPGRPRTPALPGAAGRGNCSRAAVTVRPARPLERPLSSSRARLGRRPEARLLERPLERPLSASRARVDASSARGGVRKRAGASPGRPRVRTRALLGAARRGNCSRGAETVRQAPRAVRLLSSSRAQLGRRPEGCEIPGLERLHSGEPRHAPRTLDIVSRRRVPRVVAGERRGENDLQRAVGDSAAHLDRHDKARAGRLDDELRRRLGRDDGGEAACWAAALRDAARRRRARGVVERVVQVHAVVHAPAEVLVEGR
ncbi:unnamed protein product, partial [Pelagomonas calceolata]